MKSKQISELLQKRGFNGDYAIAAQKVNTSCCYDIWNTYNTSANCKHNLTIVLQTVDTFIGEDQINSFFCMLASYPCLIKENRFSIELRTELTGPVVYVSHHIILHSCLYTFYLFVVSLQINMNEKPK